MEKKIKLWTDVTVNDKVPLISHVGNPDLVDLNAKLCSFVDGNGNWNWELCRHLLHCNTLLMIAALIAPNENDGEDQVFWG